MSPYNMEMVGILEFIVFLIMGDNENGCYSEVEIEAIGLIMVIAGMG